jgi:hypothetical protein
MGTPAWLASFDAVTCVLFTMFETTRLPISWAAELNRLTGCVVPTPWNVDVFRRSGVTVPIAVTGLGVDAAAYPMLQRDHARWPYTFLWSGTPDRRKGWDVAYRAFRRAFGDRRDVRLILRFRSLPPGLLGCRDANVEIRHGKLEHPAWLALLGEADCFVFPSRGEGWGLTAREAAATGLPVIATDWGGLAQDLDNWGIPLRTAGLVPAEHGFWTEDLGMWAEPDAVHLTALLCWCAAHRREVAALGAAASDWVHTHYSWIRTARRLIEIMRTMGGGQ